MATSKVKDVLKQGARGWAAGLAGLPGDLEGLARMAIKYGASPGSYVDRNMSETPALPTSEFYNEWLPGGDWETPEGGVAQAIGTALGGVGATKLVKPAVKAADLAAKYGVPLAEKAVANAMAPSQLSRQAGVIKAPGGNWLSGSVEDALKGLKGLEQPRYTHINDAGQAVAEGYGRAMTPAELQQVYGPANEAGFFDRNKSLNSWIDKQLTKYVKNDMATERDPVRALAERGVLHVDPGQLTHTTEGMGVKGLRIMTKDEFPDIPVKAAGKSQAAKLWDKTADSFVGAPEAGKYGPEYRADSYYDPGFNHLIDELRNATNPNSGLPADLLLKYDALDRVSVPQAVERVAKINAWREAQKVEANAAKANNAATVLHKDYPDKGFKWVELKQPAAKAVEDLSPSQKEWYREYLDGGVSHSKALEAASKRDNPALQDALKYEGDTMGHCVGGYCDDVASGASRIFSLRDKKGQPHVTIEVEPGRLKTWDDVTAVVGKERGADLWKEYEARGGYNESNAEEQFRTLMKERGVSPVDRVLQIKGKGNKKPNDEYLPFVQDFVKSGKWSDVGDLQNSGLQRADWQADTLEELKKFGIEAPTYGTADEINKAINALNKAKGFAKGGLVSQNTDYDPSKVDALVAQLQAEFA